MSQEAEFDYRDVQGIVRFGHGRLRSARFLLLKIRDVEAARIWLSQIPVTTAETLPTPPDNALQVAFTVKGLNRLQVPAGIIEGFSDEFLSGMTDSNRSRRLGDTADNAPEQWDWGGSDANMPEVMLMCYALPGQLDSWLTETLDAGFERAFSVLAELASNEHVEHEPFGFADGISQPQIDWERKQTADVHRRDRYSNLLSLGEILLGYPNEYGEYTQRPLLAVNRDTDVTALPDAEDQPGSKDLGRNGSYLVMRQLQQDVPRFWQWVNAAVDGDSEKREQLAAAMVGRQRNGEPLVPVSEEPIEGIFEQRSNRNNFNYDQDPRGLQCPVASHVRRSNPRTGDFPPGRMGPLSRLRRILGFDKRHRDQDLVASTRFHRILRRGRPYGPLLTPEQALQGQQAEEPTGLQFACLSANIARQFEFVQNAWVMNAKFAGLENEEDPLLGNRQPLHNGTATANFCQPSTQGTRRCTRDMASFVKVKGGAYFFLPGIRALHYLCKVTPEPGREAR